MASTTTTVPTGANIAILRGLIRRDPDSRVLPSGDEVLSVELSVRDGDRAADTVPVVWQNPPTSAFKLVKGDDVVVVGRVRRRFFRSGGATTSRTEVHADSILSARSSSRLRSVLLPMLETISVDGAGRGVVSAGLVFPATDRPVRLRIERRCSARALEPIEEKHDRYQRTTRR